MDVPMGDGQDKVITEVITLLQPGMPYNINLMARNRFGLGPPASKNITTQPKEQGNLSVPTNADLGGEGLGGHSPRNFFGPMDNFGCRRLFLGTLDLPKSR